jgi:hypothetical protein
MENIMASRAAYGYQRPDNLTYVDPQSVDNLLYRLLSMCSPAGYEDKIANIIINLPYVQKYKKEIIEGNLVVTVGDNFTTLFSAHMDMVGDTTPENRIRGYADLIHLMEDPSDQYMYYGAKTFENKHGKTWYIPSTLGADDKIGCWILCKLIEKGVKGLYIFHHGEERGGIGSYYLANNRKDMFSNIKRAIAYDRAGYKDVIGFQKGRRCCSTEFGKELANMLNKYMPPQSQYVGDITGAYTDTASYMDIIPECTNISCGYFNQHGPNEHFDYLWLNTFLLPAALNVDYDSLPTVRDPNDKSAVHHYSMPWRDDNEYWYKSSNSLPSKYIASSGKKSWKDATIYTLPYDLPEWSPKVGYVPEADRNVFIKSIMQYLLLLCSLKDREEMAEYIVDLMELNALLEEEVEALNEQILIMSNNDHLDEQKDLTVKLINKIEPIDVDNRYVKSYIQSAMKIVNSNGKLSKNKRAKFNRLFFYLIYILSRIDKQEDTINLLKEALSFVDKHFDKNYRVDIPENIKNV